MQIRKYLSYLGFPYTVYKINSPVNGEIKVVSVFGKNSVSVGNLTQTGPIVENLWRTALDRIMNHESKIKVILVLGVGGGSVLKVLRQDYPDCKITGVEIDEKMINIAQDYFDLNKFGAEIKIADASEFVKKTGERYDLILVDILIGREIPKKITTIDFLNHLKKILKNDGIIIMNRLRLKNEKEDWEFIGNLHKVFPEITIRKPLVNTLIYCKAK